MPALSRAEGTVCYRSFYLPEGRVEVMEGLEKLDQDPDGLVHSLDKIHFRAECKKSG